MAILKIASTFCEPVFEKRIRADINFPSVQVELDVCSIFFIARIFFQSNQSPSIFSFLLRTKNIPSSALAEKDQFKIPNWLFAWLNS